jgi:tetratricopeptide (TPR) repeat protein
LSQSAEAAFRVVKCKSVWDENPVDPADAAPLESRDPAADPVRESDASDEPEKNRGDKDALEKNGGDDDEPEKTRAGKDELEKNRADKDKEAGTSQKQEKAESEEDQKKSKTIITRVSDNIKAISIALTNLILIAALVGFIAVIINEFRISAVILDQIEVPELLQKKGITATAVSQRLLDEIRRIQGASGENSSRRRLLEPAWTREREDIQMPVANLSVRSAVQFFKRQLGFQGMRIGGELRETSNESLKLVLRTTEDGKIFESKAVAVGEFDEIFGPAGEGVIKKTDPYLLASYWFNKEVKANKFPRTLEWIKYSLANEYKTTASRAYNLLGNIYANQGFLAEAIENYRRSTTEAKPFPEAYLNWGDVLMLQGKYKEAMEKYELAASMEPRLARAHNSVGVSLTAVANYKEAAIHYHAAVERDSDLVWPRLNLADAYHNMGNRHLALAELQIAATLAERQLLHVDGKNDLSDEDTDVADLYLAWGSALLGLSEYAAAQDKFRKAAEVNPSSREAQLALGDSLLLLGRNAEAIEKYNAAITINPRDATAYLNIGIALANHGEYGGALAWYANATGINPSYLDAYYARGNLLFDRGDIQGGNDLYRQAVKIAPNAEGVYHRWGNALLGADRYEDAIDKYKKAIEINRDFAPAYSSWGEALNAQGAYQAAISKHREAIDRNSSLADAYNGWGLALANLQRPMEAMISQARCSRGQRPVSSGEQDRAEGRRCLSQMGQCAAQRGQVRGGD